MCFNQRVLTENETFFFNSLSWWIYRSFSSFFFYYILESSVVNLLCPKKGRLTTQYRLGFNSVNDQTNCRLTVWMLRTYENDENKRPVISELKSFILNWKFFLCWHVRCYLCVFIDCFVDTQIEKIRRHT